LLERYIRGIVFGEDALAGIARQRGAQRRRFIVLVGVVAPAVIHRFRRIAFVAVGPVRDRAPALGRQGRYGGVGQFIHHIPMIDSIKEQFKNISVASTIFDLW